MEIKKTMEGRKVLALLLVSAFLFSVLSIFSVPVVSSVLTSENVTLVIPSTLANNVLNGSMIINVSLQEGSGNFTPQNYSMVTNVFIFSVSKTANTTMYLANGTDVFRTLGTGNISITVNSSAFEDGGDYNITVEVRNGSTSKDSYNRSVILTINNTIPIAPTSLNLTGTTSLTTINFSSVVTDSVTTDCYLNFTGSTNPGSPSYVGSYSGTVCSFQIISIPEQSYQYYFTASDGKDATESSIATITVDQKTSAGKTVVLAQQQGVKSEGGALLSVASGNSPSDIFSRFINWIKNLFN